jgi:hypothetical protein
MPRKRKDPEVIWLDIEKLVPYPLQAVDFVDESEHDDDNLRADLLENGQRDPVHVMPAKNRANLPENTIIDGHRRARLLADIGDRKVKASVRHDRLLKTLAATSWTLEELKRPWQPESPLISPRKTPTAAELFRLVSDRHQYGIIALLVHILDEKPPSRTWEIIVRNAGERWVVISQKRLANWLKCSVRTVERTIHSLKEKGLIETKRRPDSRNMIRLCLEMER